MMPPAATGHERCVDHQNTGVLHHLARRQLAWDWSRLALPAARPLGGFGLTSSIARMKISALQDAER